MLPIYDDAALAAMGEAALLELMRRDEDRVPRNAIDECASRGALMVDALQPIVGPQADWDDSDTATFSARPTDQPFANDASAPNSNLIAVTLPPWAGFHRAVEAQIHCRPPTAATALPRLARCINTSTPSP